MTAYNGNRDRHKRALQFFNRLTILGYYYHRMIIIGFLFKFNDQVVCTNEHP